MEKKEEQEQEQEQEQEICRRILDIS